MSYFLFLQEFQIDTIFSKIKIENREFKIEKFKIGEKGKLYISGEIKSFKSTLIRLIFMLITLRKSYVYYCTDDVGKVIHTSCVIPKCIKFPFLSNIDYEIGPCMTIPEYRGKGIYPQMLSYITHSCGNEKSKFYMLVNPTNKSLIQGIKKAGFKFCGEVVATKLKQYRKIENRR